MKFAFLLGFIALSFAAHAGDLCKSNESAWKVRITTDSDSKVTKKIFAMSGGTLSTTDKAGRVYTLKIPPKALPADTEITLEPLSTMEESPLSGGLEAGVRLSPEGLLLAKTATLKISGSAVLTNVRTSATFAFAGEGERFRLHPGALDARGAVEFRLRHFSGYGTAAGTEQDRERMNSNPPSDPADRAEHMMGDQEAANRAEGKTTTREQAERVLDAMFPELARRVEVYAQSDSTIGCAAVYYVSWAHFLTGAELMFSGIIEKYEARDQELREKLKAGFRRTYLSAHQDCQKDHQVFRVADLLTVQRYEEVTAEILTLVKRSYAYVLSSQLVENLVKGCVRFEVTLKSKIDGQFSLWNWSRKSEIEVKKILQYRGRHSSYPYGAELVGDNDVIGEVSEAWTDAEHEPATRTDRIGLRWYTYPVAIKELLRLSTLCRGEGEDEKKPQLEIWLQYRFSPRNDLSSHWLIDFEELRRREQAEQVNDPHHITETNFEIKASIGSDGIFSEQTYAGSLNRAGYSLTEESKLTFRHVPVNPGFPY